MVGGVIDLVGLCVQYLFLFVFGRVLVVVVIGIGYVGGLFVYQFVFVFVIGVVDDFYEGLFELLFLLGKFFIVVCLQCWCFVVVGLYVCGVLWL